MQKKLYFFDYFNYLLMFLCGVITLYPFINIISVSFSSYEAFLENPLRILPKDFNIDAYAEIMRHPRLYTSYFNTIIITVFGVAGSLMLYVLTAYPLSKKDLRGRKIFMTMIIFTMLFNGGLIPNFYLIRSLKLYNTLTAVIIMSLFSGFNVILVKNFFESLPQSLIEAAKIDGASEIYILFKIVVPLSKAIMATMCLFTAVSYWNNFFSGVVYIKDPDKWPLMLFLREIIMGAKMQEMATDGNIVELDMQRKAVQGVSLQYATLLIVVAPIISVYPFLQKYFVKGILIGSVKG